MQKKQDTTALIWFRDDLRVNDNAVLKNAFTENKSIIAVYCLDPRHFENTAYGFNKTEKYRAKFLLETLYDLKQNLDRLNIDLLVFNDLPEACIPKICETHAIETIYAQKEWTQEELKVENAVKLKTTNRVSFKSYYN